MSSEKTLFPRITIMHVKTLDSSRRMLQCMFYDSHEKMYFHCDVFSKNGFKDYTLSKFERKIRGLKQHRRSFEQHKF